MSLLPLFLDDFYFYPQRHHHYRHPNHNFGLSLDPQELTTILSLPNEFLPIENRSRQCPMRSKSGSLLPTTGKDGFQVCIDIQQFQPNEISVKTVDNYVVVEGKHEERQDEHGFISRQFTRRYALPKGYDPETVTSSLSSDGILTIKAPLPKTSGSNERTITIQHTGPARLNIKENKFEGNPEEENKKEED